ncbi:MAG TPA: Mu-like prophage major head subunit gpT family protein, partial [Chloroflexota bacterium]|nr:Mu-like prophage major head subunit gpT family protein [Chloroflexota bacterium]
ADTAVEIIQEAIDEETAALAAVLNQQLITGMGAEKATITSRTELDRYQTALDILLGVDVAEADRTGLPKLSGIREAYILATGDPNISGASDFERALIAPGSPRTGGSWGEIREADTTTASFNYVLGTSMNKRLLKEYQAWPNEWVKFSSVVPIKDFKQQDRIRLASFGSLPVVNEDTPYTTVSLTDTRATYRASKYGNIVAVSREVIVNDDLQAIRQIPQKLAVAAAYTLAEFVYGFLSGGRGTNIYDGAPLFDAAAGPYTHGHNRRVDALATAGLTLGITTMKEQTNLAGKRIGIKPSFLVVSPELEFTALQLIKSGGLPGGNQNDINPVMGYCEVIVSPQLSNTAEWYLVADPRTVDTVEVGFVGGQVNPVLLVQDQPLFGMNFTQDVISYKVRHEYGGAIVDYRGFYSGGD